MLYEEYEAILKEREKIDNSDIVAIEPRHVAYVPSRFNDYDDMLSVKEVVHTKSGDIKRRVTRVKNYERDFYVTKDRYRNHQQKKEREELGKLKRYTTNQRGLVKKVAKAIKRGSKTSLSRLNQSPYVYGSDITAAAHLKKKYLDRWPDAKSMATLAGVDYEWDVVKGHGEIITGAYTQKGNIYVNATEEWLNGQYAGSDGHARLEKDVTKCFYEYKDKIFGGISEKYQKYIKACELPEGGFKISVDKNANAGELVKDIIKRGHQHLPDFMSIWNMEADVKEMLKVLDKYGYDPEFVFSDPSIPDEYKHFKYRPPVKQKTTSSGKQSSKHNAEYWPIVEAPASFYVTDAMCLFCQVRVAAGKRASFAFDNILYEELGLHKLKPPGTEHLDGGAYHRYMQGTPSRLVEYLVYNIFDCLLLEVLDAKVLDIANSLPTLMEHSEYSIYPSQPRRIADDLHFAIQKTGYVIGSTSDNMEEELDKYVPNMRKWIVTLAAHLIDEELSYNCIADAPEMHTNIYTFVADLDVTSSYPSATVFCNISKETTIYEVSRIRGLDDWTKREIGMLLTSPVANAIRICELAIGFPSLDTLADDFMKSIEE